MTEKFTESQYDNLVTHIATVRAEMSKLQDETSNSALLSSDRLIDVQKRFTDLQLTYNFLSQMQAVMFPPKIQTPAGHPFRKN